MMKELAPEACPQTLHTQSSGVSTFTFEYAHTGE